MADEAPNAEKPELRIGSYRLSQQLGSGGMSSVFRAVHEESGHEVAVKVLPRSLAKNPTLLQRFLREAKTAESLEHPNIVSIFDRGVDQGRHYLVLELVPGGDLHDRVRNEGPLPIAEAVRIVIEVAAGLNYASSLGLVHRDVKPANILVSPTGQVKIIDLGLALQAEADDERVTRDGTTVGTVDYMSPEQARDSRATSEKSDMYSLGCTLYYLLTGSAPFAGGNLADKLARHCTEAAPDPRTARPEVPAAVATITRKMMAKRPENRFESYPALTAALDRALQATSGQAEVLDALIADEDDDDLAPLVSGGPIDALIADDSDPAVPVRNRKPARPGRGVPVPQSAASDPIDLLSMADLAALDDAPRARAPKPARPIAAPSAEPMTALLADSDSDSDDEDVAALPGGLPRASAGFGDPSAQKLIKRSVAIGVAVVLLVIGAHQLWQAAKPGTATDDVPADELSRNGPGPAGPSPTGPTPVSVRQGPSAPNVTVVKPPSATKHAESPKPPPPWVEPGEPPRQTVAEARYPPGVESRYVPEWASPPIPDQLGTSVVAIRRLAPAASPAERSKLRLGLEVIGSAITLELADDGPFCEDDLRVPGDGRLIRARPGFRPIVKVEAPKLPIVKEQPAVVVLDGKQLVLDGLDLVVDVAALPRNQTALFQCAGGSLTLRDCTVTVLNDKNAEFAVIRTVAAAKPSRVRLERCYVRGSGVRTVEMEAGAADVLVSRSVVLTGGQPVVRLSGRDGLGETRVSLVRSVVGSRAPIVELNAPPGAPRPKPLDLRMLGCSLAAIVGATPPALIAVRGGAGGAGDRVRWLGDHNEFVGWSALYAGGTEGVKSVAKIAGARQAWPGTDPASRERPTPWPDPVAFDRVVPAQLRTLAPERLAVVDGLAPPAAFLHEKTFLGFDRPPIPALAHDLLAPKPPAVTARVSAPAPTVSPSPAVPPDKPAGKADPKAAPTGPAPPIRRPPAQAPVPAEPQPLVFNVSDAPWNGNLGLYLRAQIEGSGPRIRVYVKGRGEYPFTPVTLPVGVSVEILGDPENAPEDVPTWSPAPDASASAAALIEVRGADLVLSGVNFVLGAAGNPKGLFHVDAGHLVAYRCRLLAPGAAAPGGNLVVFRTPTTAPLVTSESPFTTPADRPTCRLVDCTLITGGDAVSAEVGRGRVALTDCAVAAGRSAFVLTPAPVARARFEADLWLDRCTVTAGHAFVRAEAWKGAAPGPDRPWLITSRASAFVGAQTGAARDHVLLRSVGDSLAHGTVFWQGSNDAFEVPHFTAVGDAPPANNPRPDLRRQWLEVWGLNHFRNPIGPGTGRLGAPSSVRFAEKLKPGEVAPRDLVLEIRDRRGTEFGADPKVLKLALPPTGVDRPK